MIHISSKKKAAAVALSNSLLREDGVDNSVFVTRDGSEDFLVLDEAGLTSACEHGRMPKLVYNPERRASSRVNFRQLVKVRVIASAAA